jgi:hypothetical protein
MESKVVGAGCSRKVVVYMLRNVLQSNLPKFPKAKASQKANLPRRIEASRFCNVPLAMTSSRRARISHTLFSVLQKFKNTIAIIPKMEWYFQVVNHIRKFVTLRALTIKAPA